MYHFSSNKKNLRNIEATLLTITEIHFDRFFPKNFLFRSYTRPLVIGELCFPPPLNELATGLHSSPEPESKTKLEAGKKIPVVQKQFLGCYPSRSLAKGSVHGWSIEVEKNEKKKFSSWTIPIRSVQILQTNKQTS